MVQMDGFVENMTDYLELTKILHLKLNENFPNLLEPHPQSDNITSTYRGQATNVGMLFHRNAAKPVLQP